MTNKKDENEDLPLRIHKLGLPVYLGDRTFYRWAAISLGLIGVLGLGGIIGLSIWDKSDSALVAITSAAITGLCSLFSRSKSN